MFSHHFQFPIELAPSLSFACFCNGHRCYTHYKFQFHKNRRSSCVICTNWLILTNYYLLTSKSHYPVLISKTVGGNVQSSYFLTVTTYRSLATSKWGYVFFLHKKTSKHCWWNSHYSAKVMVKTKSWTIFRLLMTDNTYTIAYNKNVLKIVKWYLVVLVVIFQGENESLAKQGWGKRYVKQMTWKWSQCASHPYKHLEMSQMTNTEFNFQFQALRWNVYSTADCMWKERPADLSSFFFSLIDLWDPAVAKTSALCKSRIGINKCMVNGTEQTHH